MIQLSIHTHQNVSFDVCKVSNTEKHPKMKMLFKANKALSKLKSKKDSISLTKLEKTLRTKYSVILMPPMPA